MKKIVTIGGGTGHFTLLKGLKNYDLSITSLVSMVDDGGSTGKLRDEYGILPAGDVRRCLLALSDDEKAKVLRQLFEVRFDKLDNHNFGNLFILGLEKVMGSYPLALKEAEQILGVKGKVLPITLDKTHIFGRTTSGKELKGEIEVSYNLDKDEKIESLWLFPEAFAYGDAIAAIKEASAIIICPGDLYGSIIPSFLVKGVREALQESKAKLIYVCNLVTKQGNYGFMASDFVKEIEKYMGRKIDFIILNTTKPTQNVVDKYKQENSYFVEPDLQGNNIIKDALLLEHNSDGKILARHDLEKTARLIMSLT